ncbi:hypothetical protein J5N97_017998 [Dioscorea zingiberensis]|uniref:Uncharacterized protein n=1 Tax=Dioscorea zingiberensis TaxID=325984 RepID=A0A9D5CM33_9LILI|nr:hypothetical protein J5N97_017998 [Dioscorea zingiberensis]
MEKGAGAIEKDGPKFIPGWLKAANGGPAGGAGSNHHTATSLLHSDEHCGGRSSRNRFLPVSACDHDALRVSSRSSSSFRRSTSSNCSSSTNHDRDNISQMYSSFSRNSRDRDRDKVPDRRDRDRERPFQLDSFDSSRNGKDALRRSQSMVTGKRSESWSRRPGNDSVNGVVSGGSLITSISKASFEQDFPTLGAEERQGPPEIGRVASPGLGSAIQSLPFGAPTSIRGDGWTSVLAEVPTVVGGNGPSIPSSLQNTPVAPAPTGLSTTTGLNMAETLAQTPSRVRADPQSSADTQKIDELTRRQCFKLIPVTPTMPKSLVLNSSDKSKLKGARGVDLVAASKATPQPSYQLPNHTLRAPARSDVPKASQAGNFQVLNRERNGISSAGKDGLNPTCVSRVVNPHVVVASTAAPPLKNSIDPKGRVQPTGQNAFVEKRHNSQTQNRNDFFNSIRKKTSMASAQPISTSTEKPGNQIMDNASISGEMVSSPTFALGCMKENKNCLSGCSGPSEDAESSSFDNGASNEKPDGQIIEIVSAGQEMVSSPSSTGSGCAKENGNCVSRCSSICEDDESFSSDNGVSTEKSGDQMIETVSVRQEMLSSPSSGLGFVKENGNCLPRCSGPCDDAESSSSDNGEDSFSDPVDPEEKAFLESLGWNSEDAAHDYLTPQEITDFMAEHGTQIRQSERLSQLRRKVANDLGLLSFNPEKEA